MKTVCMFCVVCGTMPKAAKGKSKVVVDDNNTFKALGKDKQIVNSSVHDDGISIQTTMSGARHDCRMRLLKNPVPLAEIVGVCRAALEYHAEVEYDPAEDCVSETSIGKLVMIQNVVSSVAHLWLLFSCLYFVYVGNVLSCN